MASVFGSKRVSLLRASTSRWTSGSEIRLCLSPKNWSSLLSSKARRLESVHTRGKASSAEKLHATVLLGDANSRMKDFYDLFTLPRLYPFDGATLTEAIAATFERRRTSLPPVVSSPGGFL